MAKKNPITEKLNEIAHVYGEKAKILSVAKKHMGNNDYLELETSFNTLKDLMINYVGTAQSNVNALKAERNTMINIDPAILGGLADGIAGPVAGIYAASEAAEYNRKRTELKSEVSALVNSTTQKKQSIEEKMFKHYSYMNNIASRDPNVHATFISIGRSYHAKKQEEDSANSKLIVYPTISFILGCAISVLVFNSGAFLAFILGLVLIVPTYFVGELLTGNSSSATPSAEKKLISRSTAKKITKYTILITIGALVLGFGLYTLLAFLKYNSTPSYMVGTFGEEWLGYIFDVNTGYFVISNYPFAAWTIWPAIIIAALSIIVCIVVNKKKENKIKK